MFPLIPANEAEVLRAEFGRRHGWQGEGFYADLQVADPTHRRAVAETIAAALAAQVTASFADHVPFLYNFLCKFPGAASELYLHRDWMYVDESSGDRTFVAWVALEDICGDNGQLRVLRGSHRIDAGLRGTDLIAPWLCHESAIRARLEPVPVRAGDCVVFDNALVHCSFPNLTEQPRVVAAVGMRPTAAALVHYRRHDSATAAMYRTDHDFLYRVTPQELMASPPDLPVSKLIPDDQRTLTERELIARLDPRARATPVRIASSAARAIRQLPTRVRTTSRRAIASVTGPLRQTLAGVPAARAVVDRARKTRDRAQQRLFFLKRVAPATTRARKALGVSADELLVVGTGSDGWIDGPDLFVRTLWTLEHRHGIAAHGVWLGLRNDRSEVDRLVAEGDRCGLGGRLRFLPHSDLATRLCGDVVLLPYRGSGDSDDVKLPIRAGLVVVSFPVWSFTDPSLRVVEHLDIEAAADAIIEVTRAGSSRPTAGSAFVQT